LMDTAIVPYMKDIAKLSDTFEDDDDNEGWLFNNFMIGVK
jgi:hypothetical protein